MNINKDILCIYDDAESFLKGIDLFEQNNITMDFTTCRTPIHLQELDDFPKATKNYLGVVALLCGIIGLILSLYMMWYMNIYSWKINLGGKPNFSLIENLPSFIFVTFEMTVLFASVGLIYYFVPLCIGKSSTDDKKVNLSLADFQDKFVIKITATDDKEFYEVERILKDTGGNIIELLQNSKLALR